MRWISKTTYNKGIWAEYYAIVFLSLKGYRIMACRYKTKVGEVDIVAKRGSTLCFVEVKFRPTTEAATFAILPQSQARIRRAAEHFMLGMASESHSMRFDVITINKHFGIRHIDNAF